jgi:hypothetical protein
MTIRKLIALASVFAASTAVAQEGVLGPPDILQFPVAASPGATGGLEVALLRQEIERGADLVFCETLMRQAKKWPVTPPREFTVAECLPEFAAKVAANEGVVHWESNGDRPTQCGNDCVSRPTLSRTYNVGRPNVRRARLYGYLNLFVEPEGDYVPNNRSVVLPFDVSFDCATTQGAREGVFKVDVDFGFPIIGDPGFWESVTNAIIAPANITSRTESGLRKQFANLPGRTETTVACASIGAAQLANPVDDKATFDLPKPKGPTVRPSAVAATVALRDQATIEFLRIKRNPLPPLIPPEIGQPGAPEAAQFTLFLNGLQRFLPPQGLALPPSGGSVGLNLCTTLDLTGADRLQLIFANDLGGSVWSQFYPAENFGSGPLRTMTTGRTVVVAGTPIIDPQTGKPRPGTKPEARLLTEFELSYRITYAPRPSTLADSSATPPRGGVRPGLQGVIGVRPSDRQVAVDPTKPPPEPCRKF